MNHKIHAFKGAAKPVSVTDIADKKPEPVLIFFKIIGHHPLLKFVSGINDNLFRLVICQYIFCKSLTERARSPGNQYRFIVQHIFSSVSAVLIITPAPIGRNEL